MGSSRYPQLKQLIHVCTARRDHAVVAALSALMRLPTLSTARLLTHGKRLSAWLAELSRLGEVAHADALVASLSAIESLTGRPQAPITLEALVVERAGVYQKRRGEPRILAVAVDVFEGCPSRERRHWDRVIALATEATR
jgi:hypothetical protein